MTENNERNTFWKQSDRFHRTMPPVPTNNTLKIGGIGVRGPKRTRKCSKQHDPRTHGLVRTHKENKVCIVAENRNQNIRERGGIQQNEREQNTTQDEPRVSKKREKINKLEESAQNASIVASRPVSEEINHGQALGRAGDATKLVQTNGLPSAHVTLTFLSGGD